MNWFLFHAKEIFLHVGINVAVKKNVRAMTKYFDILIYNYVEKEVNSTTFKFVIISLGSFANVDHWLIVNKTVLRPE